MASSLPAATIPISGGTAPIRKQVQRALLAFPPWFVRAARIATVGLTDRADVQEQIAAYEHGTRILWVWEGVSDSLILKAIGHEMAHGCDDVFGHPHYFSSRPEWIRIHRNAQFFDIPKYRDQALEYFADMFVKVFLLGPMSLSTTNPAEVTFITTWVAPLLKKEFGQ